MLISTIIFNNNYINYLKVLLQSIESVYGPTNNDFNVRIICDQIDKDVLNSVIKAFPHYVFELVKAPYSLQGKFLPAEKLFYWNYLYKTNCDKTDYIVFMDLDMILLQDIRKFLKPSYDILYTYKTESDEGLQYLLNTGFIIASCKKDKIPAVSHFFSQWEKKTKVLLSNEAYHNQARTQWGAADQAVLADYMHIDRTQFPLNVDYTDENGLKFHGEPCKYLNETRCTPITEDTHVLHYKSGWRSVLSQGKYTKNRPEKKCHIMYKLWHFYLNMVHIKMENHVEPNNTEKECIPNILSNPVGKRIFIDAGSNQGQIIDSLPDKETYDEIHAFEPAPQFAPFYEKRSDINYYSMAVWIENTTLDLYTNPKNLMTLGSTITRYKKSGDLDKNTPIKIQAIDFSSWLFDRCEISDYVYLHIDIEGAEYNVLNSLCKRDTLRFIDKLFVEFHKRKLDIPNIDIVQDEVIQDIQNYPNLKPNFKFDYMDA